MSHEAASLAGHLGLGRLVYVYDDNHITIDGPTELAYTDDVPEALRGRTAGTSCSSARSPTISTRSKPASARAWPRPTGPSAGRAAQPHRLPVAEVHRHRAGARRPARRRRGRARSRRSSACRRRTSSSPTTCSRSTATPAHAARAAREAWEQRRAAFRDARARRWPTSTTRASSSAGSPAGRRSCRRWTAGDDDRDPRTRAPTVLDAVVDVVPGLVGGGADLTGNTGMAARRSAGRSPRHRRSAAASSTSASASTAWARSMNGMAVSALAARRRHVLRVQRLHAPRGAPRRAHRSTRSRSCGRTTRSASARTARRTSRSSSSRRCGRCPACG